MFAKSFVILVTCTAALLAPEVTHAQRQSQLQVGSVVKIIPQRGKPVVGRVATLTVDSIGVFRAPGSDSIGTMFSRNDFRSIQLYAGRNRVQGALSRGLIGLGAGAIIGAMIGYFTYTDEDTTCGANGFCICVIACDPGSSAAFGGMLLGSAGLIGGVIYGAATGTEKWIDVPRR
jgi:hypothetical protein